MFFSFSLYALLGIISILLCGTLSGCIAGIIGLSVSTKSLIRVRSKRRRTLAAAGILSSIAGIVFSAIIIFNPGTPLDVITDSLSPHYQRAISTLEPYVSEKDIPLLRRMESVLFEKISLAADSDFLANIRIPSSDLFEKEADAFLDSKPEDMAGKTLNAGNMKIHFLDVGQGLSILVESDSRYLLYDGGDRNASSFVVSYLKEVGVDRLDYVIASHYDADHLNGIVGALNVFPTNMVLAPDYTASSKVYASFLDIIDKHEIPLLHPTVGTSYPLGNSSFTILGPLGTGYQDVNDYSLIIKLQNGADSVLITGDSEYTSEAELCASNTDLSATIYVAGHHGSGSSTSWDLLEKSVPEYCVIACGKDNAYGHPHDSTMEKLEAMEIEIYRTDLQGTITCISNGNGITWSQEPCTDYSPGT